MKNLRTTALCVSAMLLSLCSFAQQDAPINEPNYSKPRLFDNLPDRIPVDLAEINSLLDVSVGLTASLKLSPTATARFNGEVVSAASKFDNRIKSVVVRSSNYNGARLTISRTIDEKGAVSYTGRIISFQHGDLYELQKLNDQFVFVKKNFYDLVNE